VKTRVKRTFTRLFSHEVLWNGNRESIRMTFFSRDSIILWALKTYQKRKRDYSRWLGEIDQDKYLILRLSHPREAAALLKSVNVKYVKPVSRTEDQA
jgi:hypothetical protein